MDVNGAVRAVVGGRSWAESQFNRALKARRQPGSAFKPFVYLAALESGLTPDSTVLDLPLLGAGWSPRNEGGGYRGTVTLRDALAQSMNAAAARLNMKVGPRTTAAVARRLGIGSALRPDASLALGTSEVTLIELTAAFGAFASGGNAVEPHIIQRVYTPSGRALFQRAEPRARAVVAPAHVGAMNDMLNAVLVSGTGKRAALARHPAAGKTGTSQDFRDAWFVGYTAHLVAGVWVGNDDGRPMNRVMGGSLPARIWHDIMTVAHERHTPTALPGTLPTSAAVLAARAAPPPEPQASRRPLLPREGVGPQFADRVTGEESNPPASPSAGTRPARRGWIDRAREVLRELMP
jgi:penicillin-binding protein 1A